MQFSPNGEWFWDGSQWRPAYSPDRLWRWDGRQWVPVGPQVTQWRYEPTEWTRRLQAIVLGLMALGVLIAIVAYPTVLLPAVQQSIDRSLAAQAAVSNVDPAVMRSTMDSVLTTSLAFGVIFGAAVLAIVVIGTLKLWRWIYWLLVVGYLFSVLSALQSFLYLLGLPSTIPLPTLWYLLTILLALVEGALGIWMIVLARRYGTWARRRVPA